MDKINPWVLAYLIGVVVKTILVVPSPGNKQDPDRGFFSVLFWPLYVVLEAFVIFAKLFGLR